jgi:hypothetical protein
VSWHRLRIAYGDLIEATQFIEAARAAEQTGADPKTDVTYRALVCAAVIHYARPFVPNESRSDRKRPKNAAATQVSTTLLKTHLGRERSLFPKGPLPWGRR